MRAPRVRRPARATSSTLLGLYVPGTSPVHRAPAGVKLVSLMFLGVALAVARTPPASAGGLLLVLLTSSLARVGLGTILCQARGVLVMLAALTALQTWTVGLLPALTTTLGIAATVLAAALLTATTRADELLDVLGAVLRRSTRLPRLGRRIRPDTVALTVALMLRAVPAVAQVEKESRDAARARGLDRSPRARLVPTVVRTVAMAHRTGEALAARGLGDDDNRRLTSDHDVQR